MFTYTISSDRKTLTIEADVEERTLLSAEKSEDDEYGCGTFGSDEMLYQLFEELVCNSELEWVRPEECGALTSAPLLGIFGEERVADTPDEAGGRLVGCWDDEQGIRRVWKEFVTEVWGFADYPFRSPLDDLLATGKAEFVSEF